MEKIETFDDLLKKASDPSQNLDNIPNNLRLFFSRLEKRVDNIESNLEKSKRSEQHEEESKSSRGAVQGAEVNGIRSVVARQEIHLNDVALRLSELESSMSKLEPNNIRALIRDIAELVMQEKTKGVAETMDDLKGSEKRNELLVNMLKEELKIMDERFKQDIEKKIEKSDLNVTKSQLQRKV